MYSKVGSYGTISTILNASYCKIYKLNGRIEVSMFDCSYTNFTNYVAPNIRNNPPKCSNFSVPVTILASNNYYTGFFYRNSSGTININYYSPGNSGGSNPVSSATIFGSFTYTV